MSALKQEVDAVLDELDAELVALQPVKTRIVLKPTGGNQPSPRWWKPSGQSSGNVAASM